MEVDQPQAQHRVLQLPATASPFDINLNCQLE